MKIYIVTESNAENNILLRSWVCFTEAQAEDCLDYHYDIACTYNRIAGVDVPTDCREQGFFFWDMQNGMKVKYSIVESLTFEK